MGNYFLASAALISVSYSVDAIIDNQSLQIGRCYICSSLGLDKVKTGHNLLIELKCTH